MSEQLGGRSFSPGISVRQGDNEKQCKVANDLLKKTEDHVFLSSKSDCLLSAKSTQTPFNDDELATWLHYPLDDDTCPDIFQHWLSPSMIPATVGCFFASSTTKPNEPLQRATDSYIANSAPEKSPQIHNISEALAGTETVPSFTRYSSEQDVLVTAMNGGKETAQKGPLPLVHNISETITGKPVHLVSDPHVDEKQDILGDYRSFVQTGSYMQEKPEPSLARETVSNVLSSGQSIPLFTDIERDNIHSELFPQTQPYRDCFSNSVNKECAKANPAAEAALALGAGRAAGSLKSVGLEAFSKVRTSSQTYYPVNLGSSSSIIIQGPMTSKGISDGSKAANKLSSKSRPCFGTALTQQNHLNLSVKPETVSHSCYMQPVPNMHGAQDHHLSISMPGASSRDSPVESSMTASLGSQGSKYTTDANICRANESAAVLPSMCDHDARKFLGLPSLRPEKRDDDALPGDSETSESVKETCSGSKRTLEELECQSEDAEGESALNTQIRHAASKRTRANEVHNLSERRRRNRINDKMNALRDLIPNASKTNKAALLDEAIDYLKTLQLQLQVMSLRTGINLSPMVVPPGLPHLQAPQMSPPYSMGMGALGSPTNGMSAGSNAGVVMGSVSYGVPAQQLGSFTDYQSSMPCPPEKSPYTGLQPSPTAKLVPLHYGHSFRQIPQSMLPPNMGMNNTYHLQHHHQQQQQQLLQQPLHPHEQQVSPQVEKPSLVLLSSQQEQDPHQLKSPGSCN